MIVQKGRISRGNFILDGENITTTDITAIAKHCKCPVVVTADTLAKVGRGRSLLEEMVKQNTPIYGVNTGFGEMVSIAVDHQFETELQNNLIRSHCAGVGNTLTREESRAIMATRINTFCKGYSGVRPQIVKQLLLYLNEDIIPIIPQVGSLGASGDLAPLAHIAVTLIGEGYVFGQHHERVATNEMLRQKGNIVPLQLKFKEGLALINGTTAMTGVGSLVVQEAKDQIQQAEIIAALALETLNASSSAFQEEGHKLARPHPGQVDCAENIRSLIAGSQQIASHDQLKRVNKGSFTTTKTNTYIQKAYNLRCIPQILGAIRDTFYHVSATLDKEINGADDNPLFFEERQVFHGGNFHGQHVAFAMDFLAIALTKLGVVSERRTNRLLNCYLSNGLPEFLIPKNPGLHCGFAGVQYPATALVAKNRTISPASIQSIPSNADNQDVVSMGLIAARNAKKILKNNNYILAIEYLASAQAVDLKQSRNLLSKAGRATYDLIRENIPPLGKDRYMSDDVEYVTELLNDGIVLDEIRKEGILFFGSEIKALLSHPHVHASLDFTTIYQQMMRADSIKRTFIQEIKMLPPATYLSIKNGKVDQKVYWKPRFFSPLGNIVQDDMLTAAQKTKKLLEKAIQQRMVADFEVGAFISGGLDSAIICTVMQQYASKPIQTFSLYFDDKDYDESIYARRLASLLGTNHPELRVNKFDLANNLPHALFHGEHLTQSTDGVGKYLLAKYASKAVRVVMTGEGGDEIFLGYPWYKLIKNQHDWNTSRAYYCHQLIIQREMNG